MCYNVKHIRNKYSGQSVLVNCGHCPACRQQKADRLARRIKFEAKDCAENGSIMMFVLLDYNRRSVPFVYSADIERLMNDSRNDSCVHFHKLSVWRLNKLSRSFGSSYLEDGLNKVTDLELPSMPYQLNYDYINQFHLKQKHGNGKIGVINYKDLQDFEKRVLSMVRRSENPFKVKFYNCSEYGTQSFRPHFHLAVSVPADRFGFMSYVIRKCWPFSDWNRPSKQIQVSRDIGNYIASYCNCSAVLPDFLLRISQPKHSFSKYYGFDGRLYTYEKVSEMVYRGNLRLPIMFDKFRGEDSLRIMPAHVLYRYYPKFKGVSRLDSSEIFSVIRRPENLSYYAKRLEYTGDDLQNNIRIIQRGYKRTPYYSNNDPYTYALEYERAWSVWYSNLLADWYDTINTEPLNERYDNVGKLMSVSAARSVGLSRDDFVSPNFQRTRIAITNYYTKKFHKKLKHHQLSESLDSLRDNFSYS